MLYCYPPSATKKNWLQACLLVILRRTHTALEGGLPLPAWSALIPAAYKQRLSRRTAIKDRILAYAIAFESLPTFDQQAVRRAMGDQNRIEKLLKGTTTCARIDDLPEVIRKPAKELGSEAFRLITEFKIRKKQYELIYAAAPKKVCPFCGLEHFGAPGTPSEDLDHYLPRSKYPFAAANLKNLPPMGDRCNTAYKRAIDPIWDGVNARVAINPYGLSCYAISLRNSDPFGGHRPDEPRWEIEFSPDTPEAATWDAVFAIRERYEEDHLKVSYIDWLGEFRKWASSLSVEPSNDTELVRALERYLDFRRYEGLSDRSFLKAAVFEMLLEHCLSGHRRLLDLLMDVVSNN
jgi:hypothetical protein